MLGSARAQSADPSGGDLEALASLLRRAERIAAFTGAGVSTESGVPDFRSPGSPWRIHKPVDFQAFVESPAMRSEAWRRKFAMDDIYAGAKPGRPHRALARLAEEGRLIGVITQNIDGLHQAAGLPAETLVELHGNGTYARCLSCGKRHELAPIREVFEATGTAPDCACDGLLKSASIAFGQPLEAAKIERATELALTCDVMLVLGSSLMVRPAARFPDLAQRNGAKLAIVNRQPTPLDAAADVVLHADVGTVLTSY